MSCVQLKVTREDLSFWASMTTPVMSINFIMESAAMKFLDNKHEKMDQWMLVETLLTILTLTAPSAFWWKA